MCGREYRCTRRRGTSATTRRADPTRTSVTSAFVSRRARGRADIVNPFNTTVRLRRLFLLGARSSDEEEVRAAAQGEADRLVEPDRAGVGRGGMQEGRVSALLMPAAIARTSRVARPLPRWSGAVQTALISVQPGGRSRSPARAMSRPRWRMPR